MPDARRLLLLAIIALAGSAGISGAWADETTPPPIPLPQYDRSGYCFYAGVNSTGVYDRQKCMEDEERSAAIVAQQWERMPREVQITCGHIVRESGRSYFILKACLRNLGRAAWSEWEDTRDVLDRSQQIAKGFRR